MKYMNKTISLLLCITFLLFCFSGCSSVRISSEDLAALREQYPYDDWISDFMNYSFDDVQTWEQISNKVDIYAVVAFELTGDWYTKVTEASPFKDTEPENLPDTMRFLTAVFHDAVVEQVLWGGNDIAVGDTIPLVFGTTAVMPVERLNDTYESGNRYVCLLFDSRDNAYGVEAFGVEKMETFHLTNENVLIASSQLIACIDECSGMYLDSFTKLVHETLGEPDAELTPVEPEVQVQ